METHSTLCAVCKKAVTAGEQDGFIPHHQTGFDLEIAATHGCYICGTIQLSETWRSELSLCRSATFESYFGLRSPDHDSIRDGLVIGTRAHGYCWTFQLWREPDPSCIIQPYVPASSIDDPALAELALAWLKTCCDTHDDCRILDQAYRPTRLIHIIDTNHLRLVLTAAEPFGSGPYVAFSHCWGKVNTIKLLCGNLAQLRAKLDLQQLPNTYQEAVRLCLQMVFHYDREAKDMKLVYEHAAFNLCSATASDSDGRSFTARDPKLLQPESITIQGENFQLVYENLFNEDIIYCTLRSRAWVFQEWYLSKRSLILGSHQLWWHCRQQLACEIRPTGVPKVPGGSWWEEARTLKEATAPTRSDDLNDWNGRVEGYTRTDLTRETDRLVAFSGIVQSFGQSRGIIHEYMAGLWRCHLPAALCWRTITQTRRSAVYAGPPWSWTSLAGGFHVDMYSNLLREPCYASFERISPFCNKGMDNFSLGGIINISGYVFEVDYVYGAAKSAKGNFSVAEDSHLGVQLFLDERTEDGELMSHLSKPDLEKFDRWVRNEAVRKVMHPKDAEGQFFFLLLLDRGDVSYFRFRGLVLYQPLEQQTFYRVGHLNWRTLPQGISPDQLSARYSRRTILIV
ncbi:HET domain-containing protein [Fusarium sp. LHS14.1]|nr:HET domain-containing protein [Fusarium sp. LHS14.1]